MTLKAKWLEALRSGKYEQGIGYLCRDNKYCCIGVLADVKGLPFKMQGGQKIYNMGEYTYGGTLPDVPHSSVLINMNDSETRSFNEIADYIEKNITEEALCNGVQTSPIV